MRKKDSAKRDDDALGRLAELQQLGQALFEREAGRLARKRGLEDPRTQRMLRAAGGAQQMLSALEVARDSRPATVSAGKDESVVYGRVASDDLKGAANVEITLEDASGRVMRAAGSASSDASGRFVLRIPAAVAAKLAGKEYIITARSGKDELIYRAADTIRLALNQAIEVEVNLGARAPLQRPPAQPGRPGAGQPGGETETPPRPKPGEAALFSVAGRVLRATGKPAAAVLVRIYDKDRQYDDLLGAALTNRKGEFSAQYRLQDFSEGEAAADLYFVVVDASGTELLSTADKVIFNAERECTVTLTVSAEEAE